MCSAATALRIYRSLGGANNGWTDVGEAVIIDLEGHGVKAEKVVMWEERVNEMLAVGAGAVNNFNVVYDERGMFFLQTKKDYY